MPLMKNSEKTESNQTKCFIFILKNTNSSIHRMFVSKREHFDSLVRRFVSIHSNSIVNDVTNNYLFTILLLLPLLQYLPIAFSLHVYIIRKMALASHSTLRAYFMRSFYFQLISIGVCMQNSIYL